MASGGNTPSADACEPERPVASSQSSQQQRSSSASASSSFKDRGYSRSKKYYDYHENTYHRDSGSYGRKKEHHGREPSHLRNVHEQMNFEQGSYNQTSSGSQDSGQRAGYSGNYGRGQNGNQNSYSRKSQEKDGYKGSASNASYYGEREGQRHWNKAHGSGFQRDNGRNRRDEYQNGWYDSQTYGNHSRHYLGSASDRKARNVKHSNLKQTGSAPREDSSEESSGSTAPNSMGKSNQNTLVDVREAVGEGSRPGTDFNHLSQEQRFPNHQRQKKPPPRKYSRHIENKSNLASNVPSDVMTEENVNLPISQMTISDSAPYNDFPRKKQTYEKRVQNKAKSSDFDQREKLVEQLSSGKYECMVCCDSVKQAQAIWSCSSCYNVFHIGCIKKWANTAATQGEEGWRCPACQTVRSKLPSGYFCFCGKVREPQWNYHDVPHSCGDLCLRPLSKDGEKFCDHKCNILCHPGPCPPCTAQIQRTCPCGKTTKTVKCNTELEANFCVMKCAKLLKCLKHECSSLCHSGDCPECEVTYEISCYCGNDSKVIPCTEEVDKNTKFACEAKCGKTLACGNHKCELSCHPGNCMQCLYLPEVITTCPCGQTSLEKLYEIDSLKPRTSCKDPILTCGKVCSKELGCGPPEKRHICEAECHTGLCPVCPRSTEVRCRCGRNEIEISCKDYKKDGLVLCERKCNKKRHCGRHKCLQTCCVDVDHICTVICGRPLPCGNHTCEELCHTGACKRCLRASFEELTCHCGAAVLYPPVACGTRPPECSRPCSRRRVCPHPPNHDCHSDPSCPPCTALTERWCFGRHELRKSVLCYVDGISCGRLCGKPLPCGRHTCIRTCHDGVCSTVEQKCAQPCPTLRPACGHPCGVPCHEGECPDVPCRAKVSVSCQCGHRKAVIFCEEQQSAYKKIATEQLFSKMSEMNAGQSISLDSVLGTGKLDKSKSLKCDEECAQIDRNRRLALALQIRNPDLIPKPGPPAYSQFMKEWARKDSKFVQMVHEKLSELVQLAKQSKQKSRQYSFPVMNREKRQFVHEYCEFFGCESQAFDEEPHRNVVATAYGEKSWLPAQALVDVCMRESGQRKIPLPPAGTQSKKPPASSKTQTGSQAPTAAPSSGFSYARLSDVVKGEPKPTAIDYFDMTE